MLIPRVIPCLLLRNNGLVKTVQFKNPTYVGDPMNAIKIFNEKEVDELIFLDITATVEQKRPPFEMIEKIASECFMPVCYGGGLRSIEDIRTVLSLGIEKVSIASCAAEQPEFIRRAADTFGSQSIAVCMDVKKKLLGSYEVVTHNGKKSTGLSPVEFAEKAGAMGAGELLVNSVDRDGTMQGYDLPLVRQITGRVGIPVIASGGAGSLQDIRKIVQEGGASAGAAGSLFVFYGKLRAVLINYPGPEELGALFP